ncbi:odorant receptor 13a-like [Apis laboriosa]|uniref:odorant receptor 13a-like n=1 Tax=Apis laboriosa TaxID=183418 RepID=UPI001CC635CD|nr:odorant receptor 13a-like [Apis laboriosa]
MHKEGYTDMSLKVSQFLLKVAGIWVIGNNAEERQRKFAVFYTLAALIYGIYVNAVDIYHNLDNFAHCVFLTSNIMCILLGLFKCFVISFFRMEFSHIVSYAQKHFWRLDYDYDEKILFGKCQKFCRLWIIVVSMITQSSLAFYIITPIYENIGKNKSDRILPFKMWVDLPLSVTPYYEIMFVIQLLAVEQIGIAYVCSDFFLCILNLHALYQFRMMQQELSRIWSSIDEQTTNITAYTRRCHVALKKCIRRHQSLIEFCNKLEQVFTFPILSHVVVFSLLMCFDTYEILLADIPTLKRFIFICHMIGSFIHIIFFTYICHGLIEESGNVGLATYSGWWTTLPMNETGRMLRKDIKMIMMKSMRPCYLSAGGFFPMSLETSTALVSSTMSYFTLMRESSMKTEQRFYLLQYFIRGDRTVENRRLVRAQGRVLRSDRIHSEEFLAFLQRSTRSIDHHWVQENMQLFHRPHRLLCPRHLRRLHGHSAYRLTNLEDAIRDENQGESSRLSSRYYENYCYEKLKDCVGQHQTLIEYCKRLENIFTVMVLGQVMFLAVVICLVGFQLLLVHLKDFFHPLMVIIIYVEFIQADTPASKKASLVLNLGGTFFQLLIFTYSCDNLIRQSVNVGNAVFSGPWVNLPMSKAGILVRKNLIIVIMRSQKVCCLTAGKFFPVSLETFTAVLSTAMSYFTLLKHSSLENM